MLYSVDNKAPITTYSISKKTVCVIGAFLCYKVIKMAEFICKYCGNTFIRNHISKIKKRGYGFCNHNCAYKHKHSLLIERFWSYVIKSGDDDCWIWTGGINIRGYGRFWFNGRLEQAHRFAYILTKGEIPLDLYVCHSCDNPKCCNPNHLWIGTAKDNSQDMVHKGRHLNCAMVHPEKMARGENHGSRTHPESMLRGSNNKNSKLTEQQVVEIRNKYAKGGISYSSLAIEYNVDMTNIACIVKRKTWKHVHETEALNAK